MSDKEFWMLIRQSLLLIVDTIERKWNVVPTTSEIRKQFKLVKTAN